MPELNIDTGRSELDGDLRVLFDLHESGRLADIRSELVSAELSLKQFTEKVPGELLRIGTALSNPLNYTAVLDEVADKARPILENARQIVETELTEILSHPLGFKHLDRFLKAERDEKKPLSGLAKSLHVVGAIDGALQWLGEPPELAPAVRIAFLNREREVLLDTSLHWNDLFYVIGGLLTIATRSLEAGRVLHDKGQLALDSELLGKLAAQLNEIDSSLRAIRALARAYDIPLETSNGPAAAEAGKGTTI